MVYVLTNGDEVKIADTDVVYLVEDGRMRLSSVTDDNNVSTIITQVCMYYGKSLNDLRSHTRYSDDVEARRCLCFFLRKRTLVSLQRIAGFIGKKNHATVVHHVTSFGDMIDCDERVRSAYMTISRQLDSLNIKDNT